MLIKSIIFIFFLNFAHAEVKSDTCTSVDLHTIPNSPLLKMPILDQDGSRTCFSHAATQLIDYWRIEHGASPKDMISPIYAAWVDQYQSRSGLNKKVAILGGSSVNVMKALKKEGYLSINETNACLEEFIQASKFSTAELLHFFEEFFEYSFSSLLEEKSKYEVLRDMKAKTYFNSEMECKVNRLAAVTESKKIFGESATLILSDLFSKCKKPKSLANIPNPNTFFEQTDEGVQKRIDEALNSKKPASIGMCAKVLRYPYYRGQKYKKTFLLDLPYSRYHRDNRKEDCGSHELLVTARKKINGECKYLLRNSWGGLWEARSMTVGWKTKKQDCACILNDGTYLEVCKFPYLVKEYVGCWFNSKDLIPNTFEVNHL